MGYKSTYKNIPTSAKIILVLAIIALIILSVVVPLSLSTSKDDSS